MYTPRTPAPPASRTPAALGLVAGLVAALVASGGLAAADAFAHGTEPQPLRGEPAAPASEPVPLQAGELLPATTCDLPLVGAPAQPAHGSDEPTLHVIVDPPVECWGH